MAKKQVKATKKRAPAAKTKTKTKAPAKKPAAKKQLPAKKAVAKKVIAKKTKKPAPKRTRSETISPSAIDPAVAAERRDDLATRAAASRPIVEQLGTITVPSGKLALFDIGLVGYMPRDVLDTAMVKTTVPSDRPLVVTGTRVGKGRFAECWDNVSIDLAPGDVFHSKKLGEASVDFARIIAMDHAALDQWQHDDSLDGKADVVFWGRDEKALAEALRAPRTKEGYGWIDLPLEDAETKVFEAEMLKADNQWGLNVDFRPHSHHFQALAAVRASPLGAGTIELAGTQLLLMFTSWGDGVFPIYLDSDADEKPVRVRIQLATAESTAAMTAVAPDQ